ncbi:MAG: YebC/PmpR family DNA-binding transcriptional regulator [Planctomycetota bacterium]|nr:YebC/PmpR family DNA-binding transcriptional regulator [Planctomycetota bacterium]
MAGHSHWANIKHKKAAIDKKRGKIWSKCSRAILVAARMGGGDPKFNNTLRFAIDEARAANMPRDTIEKLVKRGTGELGGENYEAVRYEGYGPGGVAFLLDCLIANANKTAAEVRTIFDKQGGNLGVPGSVAHSFVQKGQILIDATTIDEDRLMELALEAGADDVVEQEGIYEVSCAPTAFLAGREALEQAGLAFEQAEVVWSPTVEVSCDEETGRKVLRLVEALEDHDDIQKVWTNADLPDAVLES